VADEKKTDLTLPEAEEPSGPLGRLARWSAQRKGAEVVDKGRLDVMEAMVEDRRILRKDLDLIAWTALDYVGGSEQDLKAVARRKLVQQARVAWQQDPQLGAATDLMNDFSLGRGIPRPKARDEKVQQVLDEAWEDEDNQLVLTSYPAQLALGTDLTLQANLFLLQFTGDDGRVKLGLLDHDTVENVVRDPDNRRRILYYVSRRKTISWDFKNDAPAVQPVQSQQDRILYYQHWLNEPGKPAARAPESKVGKGKVYHVAINRTSEMAFGHPTMHRILRWANAFNGLMEARVDMARAAAAFLMKRKVKGTPNQIQKMATKALSRKSELARGQDPEGGEPPMMGPDPASIITENEMVEHERFNLDSNAANANVDSQMIRSQISAATHFPQHYLGDIGSANLATATTMELPVLKAVESRQEIFESMFRWFFDRVIEEAIAAGRLDELLSEQEMADREEDKEGEGQEGSEPTPGAAPAPGGGEGTETETTAVEAVSDDSYTPTELGEPPEDEEAAEVEEDEESKRDLGYDFSMPSPLRRMMSDLVNAVATIARTFDPNNTNLELSRLLLGVVLGESLEVSDPAEAVESIFPPGYKDPAMAALEAQQAQQSQNGGGPPGGIQLVPSGKGDQAENPYGAPMRASAPEANPYGVTEAALEGQGGVLLGEPTSRGDALDELRRTLIERSDA
jgi:hypothetical protein